MSITAVGTWVGEQIAGKIFEKFNDKVIERWSRYRRERFFEAFCDEMAVEIEQQHPLASVNEILEKVLEDENKSETLFEAYRQVSLSKSKKIGPRIIGFLTAEIILKDGLASVDEELLFEIAERSSDADLLAFSDFYDDNVEHSRNTDRRAYTVTLLKNGDLEIVHDTYEIDSNWDFGGSFNMGAINLADDIGDWAVRFRALGVLVEKITDKTKSYQEDSERHIDQDGTLRTITWIISIPSRFKRLRDLIVRANF